jgi:hypothetical protein
MDIVDLLLVLGPYAGASGALGWSVYVHRAAARKAELAALAGRIDAVVGERQETRERLTQVEQAVRQSPDKDAVHNLEVAIARLSGDLKVTVEKIDGMQGWAKRLDRVTERIEQFLLDKGTKI